MNVVQRYKYLFQVHSNPSTNGAEDSIKISKSMCAPSTLLTEIVGEYDGIIGIPRVRMREFTYAFIMEILVLVR